MEAARNPPHKGLGFDEFTAVPVRQEERPDCATKSIVIRGQGYGQEMAASVGSPFKRPIGLALHHLGFTCSCVQVAMTRTSWKCVGRCGSRGACGRILLE